MALELITPAEDDPVTVAAVKARLRIEGTTLDALITALIPAATRHLERAYGCAFLAQTWHVWFDAAPGRGEALVVPLWPAIAVESVTTYTDADVATELPAASYYADVVSQRARILLRRTASWPTGLRALNAIAVQIDVGHATAADVPEMLQEAVAQLVGHWLDQPPPTGAGGGPVAVPFSVHALMTAAGPLAWV